METQYVFIRIDPSSVRANKNAGQSTFFVPGITQTRIEGGRIIQERPIQTIRTLTPVPKYSYDYMPTEVMCPHCLCRYPHTDLVDSTDWDYDDEGDYEYGSRVECPICGEDTEIWLEFEKFKEDIHGT